MLLQMALFQGISEFSDSSPKWSSVFQFPLWEEMWTSTRRISKVSPEFEESGPLTHQKKHVRASETLILDHAPEGCLTHPMVGTGPRPEAVDSYFILNCKARTVLKLAWYP